MVGYADPNDEMVLVGQETSDLQNIIDGISKIGDTASQIKEIYSIAYSTITGEAPEGTEPVNNVSEVERILNELNLNESTLQDSQQALSEYLQLQNLLNSAKSGNNVQTAGISLKDAAPWAIGAAALLFVITRPTQRPAPRRRR